MLRLNFLFESAYLMRLCLLYLIPYVLSRGELYWIILKFHFNLTADERHTSIWKRVDKINPNVDGTRTSDKRFWRLFRDAQALNSVLENAFTTDKSLEYIEIDWFFATFFQFLRLLNCIYLFCYLVKNSCLNSNTSNIK